MLIGRHPFCEQGKVIESFGPQKYSGSNILNQWKLITDLRCCSCLMFTGQSVSIQDEEQYKCLIFFRTLSPVHCNRGQCPVGLFNMVIVSNQSSDSSESNWVGYTWEKYMYRMAGIGSYWEAFRTKKSRSYGYFLYRWREGWRGVNWVSPNP